MVSDKAATQCDFRSWRSAIKVLGIDIGTGGSRSVILDELGCIVASATEDHRAFASPQTGWAEQEPEDWWRACQISVPKVLKNANLTGDDISCVGISGQMHGAVVLDARGHVIRPAPIWCDQRTERQSFDLAQRIGLDRIIQLTSNAPLTNFTLTKFLWMRENEPHNWDRVQSVMLPKDYVRFRLTGECATDMADASGTLLLDVGNRRWSSEMLDRVGMDERVLPKLYESPDICGQVSRQGATSTGLKAGTPVVAGAGDQAAGAISMGIVRPGTVSVTIGTSGVVFAATDRPVLDPKGRLHTFCHALPGRWHVMGVTQAAGLSLRWFRDRFGTSGNGAHPYDLLCEEAKTVPSGADGLLWAPYLMGERTPHLDPNARGALVGLTSLHERAHIIRAILEGVAFSLRDTFTIFNEIDVPVYEIRLGGGGARSPLWRQIQADIFGSGVETVQAEEGAAYGAAILAGVGAKVWQSVDEACQATVRTAQRVAPDPQAVSLMNSKYLAYRRVYPAVREIFAT